MAPKNSRIDGRVIRFGLRSSSGRRSSSWRVWANPATPDVYVANRDTAPSMKVSLHKSGRWRHAFTSNEIASAARHEESDENADRVIMKWDSEDGRLAGSPIRQGFAIVLGGFSLGLPPEPNTDSDRAKLARWTAGVEWVEESPPDGMHAWQFTVLVADGGIQTSPPGVQSMGAVPVGGFELSNGGSLWVMRHPVTLGAEGLNNIERAARAAVERFGPPTEATIYSAEIYGKEPEGLRWAVDVAVTATPKPPSRPD